MKIKRIKNGCLIGVGLVFRPVNAMESTENDNKLSWTVGCTCGNIRILFVERCEPLR